MAARLTAIIDGSGMLNTVVSRQMSQLSRYSVRSVHIAPEEDSRVPFTLKKLIDRGGFGNVYLAQMESTAEMGTEPREEVPLFLSARIPPCFLQAPKR